jgi:hypothetical protein
LARVRETLARRGRENERKAWRILGILELGASFSLLSGGAYGRWFGIIVGSLAAIGALLSIPAYPLWSIAVFALSLWIVYGLEQYEPDV